MLKNESFQDVEISNINNIDEIMIIADNPPKNLCSFPLIILFSFFLSTILFSFSYSLQNYFQVNFDNQKNISNSNSWTYHFRPKLTNISPQMSSFLLTIVLSTPFPKTSDINLNSITDIFNYNQFLKFKPYISSSINLFKDNQHLKFINLTLFNSKIIDKFINGNISNQLNNILYLTKDRIYLIFDLFYSESIVFDSIQIDFDIYGKVSNKEEMTLITKTKNNYISFVLSIYRIICSLILIKEIIYSTFISKNIISLPLLSKVNQRKIKNTNNNQNKLSQAINIEIFMTFILVILCLLYVDPFLLIHYFKPKSFHLAFKVAFRDLFFSYLFFYMISIFDYFERRNKMHNTNSEISKNSEDDDNEKSFSFRIISTFIFSVLIFVFLFIQNANVQTLFAVFPKVPFLRFNYNSLNKDHTKILSNSSSENEFKSEFGRIINRLNVTYDSLNICHFIVLAFCAILVPIKIFTSYVNVKKTITSNRYIYYSVTTLSLIILLIFYSLIKLQFFTSSSKIIPVDHIYSQNTHKLIGRNKVYSGNNGDYCFVNESFFCDVFPMTLFTIYVVLMAKGHHDSEIDVFQSDGYTTPDLQENGLGVDVDEKK